MITVYTMYTSGQPFVALYKTEAFCAFSLYKKALRLKEKKIFTLWL